MATATRRKRPAKGRKKNRPTWAAMARAAGAVHPRGTAKAGKIMSKNDALKAGLPVKFFLTKGMIKDWASGGGSTKSVSRLKKKSKSQAAKRRARSVSWPRAKKYTRGPKKSAGGKYKPGYGAVRTIKLYRGAKASKRQLAALRAQGFAGGARSRGGTAVKLNPRRKRRKARRKNPAAARAGGTVKRRKRRRKSTRKAARRPAPVRRKRRRKAKANPGLGRKRRRRVRAGRKANPPRRRRRRKARKAYGLARRRKNPVRRRRNPGIMSALGLDQVMQQSVWIFAGQATLGMGATAFICETLARQRFVPTVLKTRGGNVALCAVSTGLTFAGAKLLQGLVGSRGGKLTANLPANMLAGGAMYTVISALYAFAPGWFNWLRLPRPQMSSMANDVAGLGRVYDGPYGRGGSYPGQYPGYGGFGAVESAAALVEGESLSRQVSSFDGMGDWMELSGMAGSPVPIEDLRGLGQGMGDWVEFNPSAGLVQAGWNPGNEGF